MEFSKPLNPMRKKSNNFEHWVALEKKNSKKDFHRIWTWNLILGGFGAVLFNEGEIGNFGTLGGAEELKSKKTIFLNISTVIRLESRQSRPNCYERRLETLPPAGRRAAVKAELL